MAVKAEAIVALFRGGAGDLEGVAEGVTDDVELGMICVGGGDVGIFGFGVGVDVCVNQGMYVLVAVFVIVAVWVIVTVTVDDGVIVIVGLDVCVFVLSIIGSSIVLEGARLGDGVCVRVKITTGVCCSCVSIKGRLKPGIRPVKPRMRMDITKTVNAAKNKFLAPNLEMTDRDCRIDFGEE